MTRPMHQERPISQESVRSLLQAFARAQAAEDHAKYCDNHSAYVREREGARALQNAIEAEFNRRIAAGRD